MEMWSNTVADQIQFTWNFAENYGAANGYPNLEVDWFSWNGGYFHLGGNGDFVTDTKFSNHLDSGVPCPLTAAAPTPGPLILIEIGPRVVL